MNRAGSVSSLDGLRSMVRGTRSLAWRLAHALHKWVGLLLGAWIAVLGVTGSILVFHEEIEAALNPGLFTVAPPSANASFASTDAVIRAAYAAAPDHAMMGFSTYPSGPTHTYAFSFMAHHPDGSTQDVRVFVDPYTARVAGTRVDKAADALMPSYFIPFVFSLHFACLLPMTIGGPLVGYATLVWLAATIAGLALWWPPARKWRRALTIKRGASPIRLVFDIHQASAVYTYAVMLALIVSGLSFNLSEEFRAVVKWASPGTSDGLMPASSAPRDGAMVSLAQAFDIANRHTPGGRINWFIPAGNDDSVHLVCKIKLPSINPFIDERCFQMAAFGGSILKVIDVTSGTNGDAFLAWQPQLHSGRAFGWVGRILVFVAGLACPVLFVTGAMRWSHKRTARRYALARRLHPSRT